MSNNAAGIIFSNLNESTESRLTQKRTVGAITFACRYRLIDFSLSNLVNANITNINVVVNYNHRSLREHIGTGKDWDLARREGGIRVITPYQTTTYSNDYIFESRMEALINMKEYINEFKEEFTVLMDSDIVLNISISDLINYHKANGADITFVTKKAKNSDLKNGRIIVYTQNSKIYDIAMTESLTKIDSEVSLNIFVLKTSLLKEIIEEAEAHKLTSLSKYFIKNFKNKLCFTYLFEGFVASVSGFFDYYKYSMELIRNKSARDSLLGKKDFPIYTKVNNSYPTVHTKSAEVKGSIIADECVIEGTVINSVLFRGVKIGKNSIIKNSVLFHGTEIGENAELNCIVTDKNVLISEGVSLIGSETNPFYVPKNKKV